MKRILIFLSFCLFTLISCKDNHCENNDPKCNELAPTNEVCAAFFERWFYDSPTSTCEMIAYSGCEEYGFATKEDCEACQCSD